MCSFYYGFEAIFEGRLQQNSVIEDSLNIALVSDSTVFSAAAIASASSIISADAAGPASHSNDASAADFAHSTFVADSIANSLALPVPSKKFRRHRFFIPT